MSDWEDNGGVVSDQTDRVLDVDGDDHRLSTEQHMDGAWGKVHTRLHQFDAGQTLNERLTV